MTMILLDGASLDYVLPRVAEGRLPGFARLLEKGAVMDLATVQSDAAGPGVGRGRHRHVSVEERRSIGRLVFRPKR